MGGVIFDQKKKNYVVNSTEYDNERALQKIWLNKPRTKNINNSVTGKI